MDKTFTGSLLPYVKRCLLAILFFGICLHTNAHSIYDELKEKLTFQIKASDAATVLQHLQRQTRYTFTFDNGDLKKVQLSEVNLGEVTLGEALRYLHQKYGLQFSLANRNISVKAALKQVETGHVTGRVLDARTNDPVIGATVRVAEKGTTTDVNGQYDLELPVGVYSLTISYLGYATKRITDVNIRKGMPFILNISMETRKGTLKTVEVVSSARKESVAALYLRQKNNAALSDGISAEQIKVTPDNNAAQVLKRVSGLTVQDDKFVTVRGLSDRYNNVTLNGATLPSTEPNRRNFSFDIMPAALIDNIVVNKTATPDLPTEFAGGLVQVNTKDIPENNYAVIGIGGGYNTNSVGRHLAGAPRGDRDYLGFDDGRRTWWKDKWNRFEYAAAYRAGDYQKMSELNQRIPNNWGLHNYSYSPQQNYQFSLGRRIRLKNEGFIGLTIGGTYRHEELIEDEERRTNYGTQYDFKGTANLFRSSLGGVANIAYQRKGQKIAFKNLYNHLFTNETNVYIGPIVSFGSGVDVTRNYSSLTLINDIIHNRLEGEHGIGKKGFRIDWSADMINVKRDQPDTRYSLGIHSPGQPEGYYEYYLGEKTGFLGVGSSMFNSALKERRFNWTANMTIPFTIRNYKQKIKAGYAGAYRDAYFESIGLLYVKDPQAASNPKFGETEGLPDYKLFGPEYLKPGYLSLFPAGPNATGGSAGEDYQGIQQLHAGYVMLDAGFLKRFRLVGGVRLEQNRVEVNTQTYNPNTGYPLDSVVTYNKRNWLPSANLIYSLTDKMNIRLAYSETLSRPDFRERSAFRYYEFKERTPYNGATGLKDAKVTNMDVRYEYYISANEVASISGFYKEFASPIELVVGGTPSGQAYFYFNLRSSTAYGLEADFRKSLGFMDKSSAFWKNIYISGNATWMKGNVRYNTGEMLNAVNSSSGGQFSQLPPDSRKRPLQGLSPYIYNTGIGYFGKPVGLNVSYNKYGRRIVAGGLYPYMDQYEHPRDVLDLQISTRLLKDKLDLRLNISDLLQQPFVIYDNVNKNGIAERTEDMRDNINNDPEGLKYNPDLDYTRFRSFRGSNISLNISYNF